MKTTSVPQGDPTGSRPSSFRKSFNKNNKGNYKYLQAMAIIVLTPNLKKKDVITSEQVYEILKIRIYDMILNIWFNVANSTEFKELALLSSSQVYPNVSYGAHEGYHHCIRQYNLYLPASTLRTGSTLHWRSVRE